MALRKISIGVLIAIAATGLFLTMLTAGVISTHQKVPSGGTVSAMGVGVYTNSACTHNCTSLDWGTLAPGNSTTKTVYIKNTGVIPAVLSLTSANCVPSQASMCLALTWNRADYVLAAGESISATLTLIASAEADSISTFCFDIVITGTQQ